MAQIRRKGERGKPMAGTVLRLGGAPWPTARRSSASGKQGLRAMIRRTEGIRREREREREEVKAISPRPRTRSEDTTDAVVAMASGENPAGVHGWALEAMIHEVKGTGRRRGTRGSHRG